MNGTIIKAGENSFDALSFAIRQMPLLAAGFREYNENIAKHLAVLDQMGKAIERLDGAIRKLEGRL